MSLHLEAYDKHSIQGYDQQNIKINSIFYNKSLIVNRQTLVTTWPIYTIAEVNEQTLAPILLLKPEIIIIGHNEAGQQIAAKNIYMLAKQKISLEAMSIGAACRTFNILLNEYRAVVLGLILPPLGS